MSGYRVGLEVEGPPLELRAALVTVPWLSPERVTLDDRRSLVVFTTATHDPDEALAYAERRLRKASQALELDLEILSAEVYPPIIDLREAQGRVHKPFSRDELS